MKKIIPAAAALLLAGCAIIGPQSVCTPAYKAQLETINAELAEESKLIDECLLKDRKCNPDFTMRYNNGVTYLSSLIDGYNAKLLKQRQDAEHYNRYCIKPAS
jgi:hypothetical protein